MKRSHKKTPSVEVISYGEYTRWNHDSRELPDLLTLTEEVKAGVDVEFGMVVEILHGKGWYLTYVIEHPSFLDEKGKIQPPFTGTYHVRTNPHRFFLGDTIWLPIEDKLGNWTMKILIEEKVMAEKTLKLI